MARSKTVVTDDQGNVVEKLAANTRQIGVKVDNDLYAWLDEHRWTRRVSMSGLGATVLAEYARANGYVPPTAD